MFGVIPAIRSSFVFPPPAINTMSPAQVAHILGQAAPTNYWQHDGVNRVVGGEDLNESTSLPVESTSATLGGLVYEYVDSSATNIRDALASSGTGDVGAETVTLLAILGDPVLTPGKGIFGNRTNAAGNHGFLLQAFNPGLLRWLTDDPTDNERSIDVAVGTGAEVVLCTRSIAGDILGIWTQAGSQTTNAGSGGTLTNNRPVQVGANALQFSAGFDCGGIMQWIGTDGDFGNAGDFAAARLAFSQALGYE